MRAAQRQVTVMQRRGVERRAIGLVGSHQVSFTAWTAFARRALRPVRAPSVREPERFPRLRPAAERPLRNELGCALRWAGGRTRRPLSRVPAPARSFGLSVSGAVAPSAPNRAHARLDLSRGDQRLQPLIKRGARVSIAARAATGRHQQPISAAYAAACPPACRLRCRRGRPRCRARPCRPARRCPPRPRRRSPGYRRREP